MAMRLSGLMSGMDTESLISQLVDAKGAKVKTAKKTQIKSNWKQEAWTDLNKKLKNLQSKYVSNMRFASSYSKKTTKVSNSSAVSVITGEKAVNGVQSLEVKQLAKTGYLTGGEMKDADGNKANNTALTKLADLGIDGEGTFSIKTGAKSVDVNINGDMTISDVLNKFKDAGLNANFDEKNQRFFISAKNSGAANDFSITASDANGDSALAALGLKTSLSSDQATLKQYQKLDGYFVEGDKEQTLANMKKLVDDAVSSRTNSYLDQYKKAQDSITGAQKKIDEINEKYKDSPLGTVEDYTSQLETKNAALEELKNQLKDESLTQEQKDALNEQVKAANAEIKALNEKKADAQTVEKNNETITKANDQLTEIAKYVNVTETEVDGQKTYSAEATDLLKQEEADKLYAKAEYAHEVMSNYDPSAPATGGATKVSGQDAKILLNGAEFTNDNNVFEINGLTLTALSETKEGEPVTITTQSDTDGIYDMVKNFLKEYNSVINEIDKLFNAASTKSFEPLLSEEKEAMSETEVEEYEKKIKDGILRGDSNLATVRDGLKEAMAGGINVNGKTMYLTNFGINTLGYFSSADNEKSAYHINGDPDDDSTSGNADILKGLISSDPDTVISFFTQLSQKVNAKMTDMSKSVDGYRSFGNFFDDKKMKSDYDSYNSKIKTMEDKLNEYEDNWYKKFSKMEAAMAKMQSKTNALSGLFG